MAARRNHKRRDWPRGLYETATGYFVFRYNSDSGERRQETIGRVPFEFARDEAIAALAALSRHRPSLVDRIAGATNTLADLVGKMPISGVPNTIKTRRSHDKKILKLMGPGTYVHSVTVSDCAKALETMVAKGQARTAQAIRSRLVSLFARAITLGWIDRNPAAPTSTPTPEIHRERLVLDQFVVILAHAQGTWLWQAMLLLLITGQDRDTVAKMRYAMVQTIAGTEYLVVQRSKTAKTNQPVAIPLDLGLTVLGVTLRQLVEAPNPLGSEYLVHHATRAQGCEAGDPVPVETITKAFTAARRAAGIPDTMPSGKNAPTFYEIKSLAKRLYKAQGNVDTQHLFSHLDAKTDALYADPRGVEPIFVRIK